jgi:hypothetical protein
MADAYHLNKETHLSNPQKTAKVELRAQEAEDPAEGVLRGDAVGQTEELGQPVLLGGSRRLHRRPGLGARDDGADGDADDVEQLVPPSAFDAGVDQIGKVMM